MNPGTLKVVQKELNLNQFNSRFTSQIGIILEPKKSKIESSFGQ